MLIQCLCTVLILTNTIQIFLYHVVVIGELRFGKTTGCKYVAIVIFKTELIDIL